MDIVWTLRGLTYSLPPNPADEYRLTKKKKDQKNYDPEIVLDSSSETDPKKCFKWLKIHISQF